VNVSSAGLGFQIHPPQPFVEESAASRFQGVSFQALVTSGSIFERF